MFKNNIYTRVNFREDRFVQHSLANDAIDEMKFVYDLSGQNRRPVNLAIIGEGGSGKTSLINHFLSCTLMSEPGIHSLVFSKIFHTLTFLHALRLGSF